MNNRLRYILLSLLSIVAFGASAQITAVHGTVVDEFGELTGAYHRGNGDRHQW